MMSHELGASSSSSAYRGSSSSGLTMSLTCSYRSKIVDLPVSRVGGALCRLVDLANLVFVIPASAISAVAAVGRIGERQGLSGEPVLPRGVVTLTFQALRIRAELRGGSRDDGLGRQDQPI